MTLFRLRDKGNGYQPVTLTSNNLRAVGGISAMAR